MKKSFFITALFFVLPILFFYKYVISNKVPFSGNLLVSFYSPWKQERFSGFENGIPNKPIGFDDVRIFYPNIRFTVDQLKSGKIPQWNPYIFSGNGHIGLYHTAVFYPLSFVYFVLPTIDAWSLLVISQSILAAIFMYLFLRSISFSRIASVFGAITYSYSGWMIVCWEEAMPIGHSLIWLPLGLLAVTKIWDASKMSIKYQIILFLSLVCSLLAGFFQTTIYVFGVIGVWHIFLWAGNKKNAGSIQRGVLTGIAILCAFGSAALQWLPSFASYVSSPRTATDMRFLFETYLMPWQHLITFLSPDFWGNPGSYNYFFPKAFYHEKIIYIGVLPFLFVLVTFFTKGDWKKKFWLIIGIISLSLGFQLPTSWLPYALHVPMLGSAQPSRIFAISAFALSVLSTYGFVDFFSSQKKLRKIIIGILFVATILLAFLFGIAFFIKFINKTCLPNVLSPVCGSYIQSIASYLHQIIYLGNSPKSIPDQTTISMRNLILPFGFVAVSWILFLCKDRFFRIARYVVIVITLVSSFYFAQKFLFFSERQFVFPKTDLISKLQEVSGIDRVWGYGNAYVENNLLSYFSIYSVEGYAPFFQSDYAKLLNTIRTKGKWSDDVNRADVDLSPASETDRMTDDPYRLRIMQILGVSVIIESKVGERKSSLTTAERFPDTQFLLLWENELWRVWRYKKAVSRIHFVTEYVIESNRQKATDLLFSSSFDPERQVILEKDPFSESPSIEKPIQDIQTTVQTVRYTPSEIFIDVNATDSGILVISDTYDTDWRAYVDGKSQEMLRADIAIRGVSVGKGKHSVRLTYDPWSFRYGGIISFISLSVFLCLLFAAVPRKKN